MTIVSQSKPQAPPRRHHFVPEFLLKEWAGTDNLLVRYWVRADGEIDCKPTSPKGVAYEEYLYETIGLPPEHAQQMEQKFMAPLDDRAAKAHRLLVEGHGNKLSDEMACDWARFIMSLWFRTPYDTRGLRAVITGIAQPGVSERVVGMPAPDGYPEAAFSELQMHTIRAAIDDPDRGMALLNMHWGHIDLAPPRAFMISDWPLDSAKGLPLIGHPKSYITIPITPHRLFVAASSPHLLGQIAEMTERHLERVVNYAVVAQARSFVGASSDKATRFVKANFGCEGRPSIARSLSNTYGVPIQNRGGGTLRRGG